MDKAHRERRRDTFLARASDYDAARPGYPPELLDQAVELAELTEGDSIIEFGCGTGQATSFFAERGFEILALDRSEEMVRFATDRLTRFPNASVRWADFEELAVGPEYAAVLSATSYHWLDPDTRVERCASHLRDRGALIVLWHTHPRPYTGFFERVQPLYERVVPGWEPPPSPGMVEERIQAVVEQLRDGDVFHSVERRHHTWTRTYDRPLYQRLLYTYSDHMLLPAEQRETLIEEISALIDEEFGGEVERPYRTELIVARRP